MQVNGVAAQDRFDSGEIMGAVDGVFEGIEWTVTLSYTLSALCGIVLIYHFGRIAVENLVRGGEPFVFSKLKTPFFYMIMLALWPTLHGFIEDGVEVFQEEVENNSTIVYDRNQAIFAELDGGMATIDRRLKDKENLERMKNDAYFGLPGISEIGYWFSTLDDRMVLQLTAWAFSLVSFMDYCLYIVFYIVTKLWLKIVAFGAPIAFAASIMMGGWSVLLNWVKNYLSVALWLPISALMMGILNRVLLVVLGIMGNGMTGRIDTIFDQTLLLDDPSIMLGRMLGLVLQLLVIIVVFFAIKIILLAKVPSVVSTMVQAGQGLAGGFSMAFVPINVAKSTASTAAVVAGAAATGGAGAVAAGAAASKGLKKQ